MRRLWILLGALALGVTGCGPPQYLAPVKPLRYSALYTHIAAPLTVDFKETPVCTKVGTASSYYLHDPVVTRLDFAWGRVDLREAAMNGGLTSVEYADYEVRALLGIWGKFTIKAYGN